DALFHRTDLGAFAAANAILVLDVVQAVIGRVEAFVGTLDPAKRALGAEIEPDRRPLRLGGAAFEHGVSRLSLRTHLEAALHRRNRGTLLHLEPFGQHGNLVGPYDSVVRRDHLHPWRFGLLPERLVGRTRRLRTMFLFGLFQKVGLYGFDADH